MLTLITLLTCPAAVGVFSAAAAALPPPSDTTGVPYRAAYSVVNALAMNFGHAANRSAPSGN